MSERLKMLDAFVGEGVLPKQEPWPVFKKEQSAVPIPITDYALAGISCAAVQSRLIGGPGPDAPEEPKVRLARVGYVTQNTQRRSAWHADGPNPLLRPDSSSRSESKGLDVSQPPWTSHSSQG
ncbi:unnamed protein product [Durusdinium trenchii]|uniref:Uncharacterized protein n=2 Tax=Durusdinium trenchii TaxID=1381693 RepID=A0ABP0NL09_9DINO